MFKLSSLKKLSSGTGGYYELYTGERRETREELPVGAPWVLVKSANHPDMKAKATRLVARVVKYHSAAQKGLHALKKTDPLEMVSAEDRVALTMRAWAGTILVGWGGIYGDDDVEIPYTERQAEEFMVSPDTAALANLIVAFAAREEELAASTLADPESDADTVAKN